MRNGKKEFKFTKAGEELRTTTNRKKIEKVLKSDNLNELKGLADNTQLKEKDYELLLDRLSELSNVIKKTEGNSAVKNRKLTQINDVRIILFRNPSIPLKMIKAKIKVAAKSIGTSSILDNPSLPSDMVDYYFNERVMNTNSDKDPYNFVAFEKLMDTNAPTEELTLKWWNTLKKYADWTITDNKWYSIINSFATTKVTHPDVFRDFVPHIKTMQDKIGYIFFSLARNPKVPDDVKEIIFTVTGDEEFLTDEMKEFIL